MEDTDTAAREPSTAVRFTPERIARRRRVRMRALFATAVSYAVDTAILSLYALIGTVTALVPALYAAVALLAVLTSYLVFASRIAEAAEDPFLSIWQVMAGTAIQLGFLAIAPEVGLVFITVLFLVFGFGALRMSVWGAMLFLVVATVGLFLLLPAGPGQTIVPLATPAERWVTALAIAAALGRAVWLGLVGSTYRKVLAARSAEIRSLHRILPICSHCKKIRDDQGAWNQLEAYISKHADVQFSHGICGQCMREHFPDDG